MKRLVAVPVSLELWHEMSIEGYEAHFKCTHGLPEGAEMVNSYYDGARQTAVFVYQHASFEIVSEGMQIPEFLPEYTSIDCGRNEPA